MKYFVKICLPFLSFSLVNFVELTLFFFRPVDVVVCCFFSLWNKKKPKNFNRLDREFIYLTSEKKRKCIAHFVTFIYLNSKTFFLLLRLTLKMIRRYRLVTFVCFLSFIFVIFYETKSLKDNISIPQPQSQSYRGCIISLIRSDPIVGLNRLLNMLNSLRLYFDNIEQYPIYLFHEPTLENRIKEQILSCSVRLNIQFVEIVFNYSIPTNRSGYSQMCQFWSYDIWFKYTILREQCDYVMRFDDDSYLINSTQRDLFEEFHRNQFDYGFRIVYHDNNGLDFLKENLRQFLPSNQTRRGCVMSLCTNLNEPNGYDGLAVYNNFFLMRLNLMYEHTIIKEYLQQLVNSHAFYHYRIGDANIQTICLLLIDKAIKITYLKFSYNHNVHGAAELHASFVYYHNTALMWQLTMKMPNRTCRKVLIANEFTVIEKRIE